MRFILDHVIRSARRALVFPAFPLAAVLFQAAPLPASAEIAPARFSTIEAPDRTLGDQFGAAVALDGNVLAVGAPFHDHPAADQGAVYVFERVAPGGFLFVQEISVGAAGDNVGYSVALSGNTLVIGAPNHDLTPTGNEGAAYVYVRVGGAWLQQQKLIAPLPQSGAAFGHVVDIRGDRAIVGSPFHDVWGIDDGTADIYSRSATTWLHEGQVTMPAPEAESFDLFGWSAAIDGPRAIVGAPFDTSGGSFLRGSAYVFALASSSPPWTTEQQVCLGAALDNCGWSVAIQGDVALVGAPNADLSAGGNEGLAYLLARNANWSIRATLMAHAPVPADAFGHSVAFGTDVAVVGAPLRDTSISSQLQLDGGAVFFFDPVSGTSLAITPADSQSPAYVGRTSEHVGWSVAADWNTTAAGAPLFDFSASTDTGLVATTTLIPTLTGLSPHGGPLAGIAVTLTGTRFLPGAAVSVAQYYDATVSAVTAQHISAILPPGDPGIVEVAVRNPDFMAASLAQAFTYRSPPYIGSLTPAFGSAAGGTVVTITGADFAADATVTFGLVPAVSVLVQASNTMMATTGPHAVGPVDVTVTNEDGQTWTAASSFTYLDTPPTINSVVPNTAQIGKPTIVTIVGNGFRPGATASFGSSNLASPQVVSPSSLTGTVTGLSPGFVDVTVSNPDGQTAVAASAFEFLETPTITLTLPANAGTASTSFITLSGTAEDDRGISSIKWTNGSLRSGIATLAPLGTSNGKQRVGWTAKGIPLFPSWNTLTFEVADTDGLTSSLQYEVNLNALTYYLAEGATGPFFDMEIAIVNPSFNATNASIAFLTSDAAPLVTTASMTAEGRTTVRVNEIPALVKAAVSAVVTPQYTSQPLLVERTMFWDRAAWYGGHGEFAIESPQTRWYFAEGSQGFFDTWLLLANANDAGAVVTVSFLTEAGTTVTRSYDVPAHSRQNVFAGEVPELVNTSFSIMVDSTLPIVAERAMYFGGPRLWEGGHESVGVSELSTSWFLAEGATGSYFDTYVLVGNPNEVAAHLV
ncbi:MAG: IPT/TIG domain-containing protein, partial [Vicinamibacterales bacterium]